jgi:AcrR family transcriptional regulator
LGRAVVDIAMRRLVAATGPDSTAATSSSGFGQQEHGTAMAVTRTRTRRAQLHNAEPLRRAELLQLAAQLFAAKGYSVATVMDIAESADLSKATFYHYFRSKEEVFEEIVIDALTRLNASVKIVVDQEKTARDKLQAAVRAHAAFFEANIWTFTTMMGGFGGLGSAARRRAVALRSEYSSLYRQIIGDGMEAGEFAPLDARAAARGLLSMLFWMSRWYNPGGERRAIDFAEEYLTLILFGLVRRR